MSLSFHTLRKANKLRLPKFKNKHGEPAHSSPDGRDWNPGQWFAALIGELGEWARERLMFELGHTAPDQYAEKQEKELADVATYLDILAFRSLDRTVPTMLADDAGTLMAAIAYIGEYANMRKKLDRREVTAEELAQFKALSLAKAIEYLQSLLNTPASANTPVVYDAPSNPLGVNLGEATRKKFNEVSTRVGADVFIDPYGFIRDTPPQEETP